MTEPEYQSPTSDLLPAKIEHRAIARCDVPRDLDQQMRLAEAVCKAGILPKHLQGNAPNVLAIMFAARSLDLPLWQAMQELHNVEGKIGMSANMMRALWLRAGHGFRVLDESADSVTVEALRLGFEPAVVTFRMGEAKAAGLTSKAVWTKYPQAMMLARATSKVLRQVGADVLLGMTYTPDELSDGRWDDDELGAVKATVAEAAAEAAGEIDLVGIAAEIDRLTTEADAQALWRRVGGQGALDTEHDGLSLRQRILNRVEAIKAEADVVEAEIVEDEPEPTPVADLPDGGCGKCGATGKAASGYACGSCAGSGVAGGAA